MIRAARGPFVAGFLWLATAAAHANGRLPGATGLAVNPTDERQVLLGLTYGLALTRNGGASWTWMCEQQIEGNGGNADPSIVITSNGTLVVVSLTNGGVLVSRDDGCTFERAIGPLEGNRGVDLTLDTSRSGRVLALMSTILEVTDAGHPRFRNLLAHSLDHGTSWEVLAEFPDDLSAETVEIAASDPNHIYVSGTLGADPLQGIVERSDDGGHSWKRTTVQLPNGSGSLFVSGIHPKDPDRLWFRVPGRGDIYGVLPTRLWLSTDGAVTFNPVADTQAGMLGFAISPDGERVAFGGPMDGLLVAPSDGSAAPSKVSGLQVHCLRWHTGGLYVCANEPADPFSLGFAAEPTQRFVPLWRRADTCIPACTPPSPLEMRCRKPWAMIAPLIGVGVDAGLCDVGSAMQSVGIDAGSDATVDASRVTSKPTKTARASSASGCTVTPSSGVSAPWWLAPVLMLAGWMRSIRSRRRRRTETRDAQ
jgi:hypothetical protein